MNERSLLKCGRAWATSDIERHVSTPERFHILLADMITANQINVEAVQSEGQRLKTVLSRVEGGGCALFTGLHLPMAMHSLWTTRCFARSCRN